MKNLLTITLAFISGYCAVYVYDTHFLKQHYLVIINDSKEGCKLYNDGVREKLGRGNFLDLWYKGKLE